MNYSFLQNRKLVIISLVSILLVVIIIVGIASCQATPTGNNVVQRTAVASPSITNTTKVFPATYFSPYVPITSTEDTLAQVEQAQQAANGGTRYFTLGFITARAGCQATWSGLEAINPQNPFLLPEIDRLRANGGDVTLSFGGPLAARGAEQQDLAQVCSSAQSLRLQYQNVINAYQVTHIDFFIEGALLSDQHALALHAQAVAGLHSGLAGQALSVSYSLPVTAQGLSQAGEAFINSTLTTHITIDRLNFLVQDYTPGKGKTSVEAALEQGVKAAEGQIQQLEQDAVMNITSSFAITPLIGVAANASGSFTLADARNLLTFARAGSPEVSELSMWSLQRDQPCAGVGATLVLDTCSGLKQGSYDFTRLLNTFTAGVASATATATASPTGSPSPAATTSPTSPSPAATPTATSVSAAAPTASPAPTHEPTASPAPSTGNLLINPTFNSLNGWHCQKSDIAQNNTLRIIPTATTNGECTQTVSVLPNHTYILTASVRGSYAYMQVGDQANSVFSTDYTQLTLHFTTDSATTSITVSLHAGIAQPEVDVQAVALVAT